MLEIVAGKGFGAVTVRKLAQVAGVSSRAFYQNYSSKEECFLRTHELVVRRLVRSIEDARVGEGNSRKCFRATIHAFLDELQREPRAAHMFLIDGYVAGSMALDQVRRAERRLEVMIAPGDDSGLRGVAPPELRKGVVVGLMCVARSRLFVDQETRLTHLTDELTDWAAKVVRAFGANSTQTQSPGLQFEEMPEDIAPLSNGDSRQWAADGDRALILAALARLAASEGYDELTVSKIRESAGASSRKFAVHFTGVAECFQEAVELYARKGMARLDTGNSFEGQSIGTVINAIALLCESVAHDPTFANLCFVDVFGPGPIGAQNLSYFIEEIGDLLFESGPEERRRLNARTEAGAGAVWGVMRETIMAKGGSRVPEMAPALKAFVPDPDNEPGKIENIGLQNLTNPNPAGMLVPRAERVSSALTVTTK